jgi:hypothetical protein
VLTHTPPCSQGEPTVKKKINQSLQGPHHLPVIFFPEHTGNRVVDEISLSRNFAKYLFRISRNNFFLFREISYREIVRNFAKFREISRNFCDEIKVFTG